LRKCCLQRFVRTLPPCSEFSSEAQMITRRVLLAAGLVTLVSWSCPEFVHGQSAATAEKSNAKKGPERWEGDIAAIEKRFAARVQSGVSRADVVFVGSSSIRRWELSKSFPELDAVNHGFGGSQLSDSVHFFSRVVAPAKPRIVVLYAGDNDLNDGKTPDVVVSDFEKFLACVDRDLPSCERVIWVCIKPSIKRWKLRDAIQATNERIRKICEAHPKAVYADVWGPSLNAAGEPKRDLLAEDDLHLTDAGYEVWASVVGPLLK
jgi:lysophospholipase L1-like esterase